MLSLWVFVTFLIGLSCISPHYFFQKIYTYLLGFKEKQVIESAHQTSVYLAIKPFFWFAVHIYLFLHTFIFLKLINTLFFESFFIAFATGILCFLLLFVACLHSFRFSYIFTFIFAIASFYAGVYALVFPILVGLAFLLIPNLEILVYVALLVLFALMAVQGLLMDAIISTVVLLLLCLVKHYFLAKTTQMDWTKRLYH